MIMQQLRRILNKLNKLYLPISATEGNTNKNLLFLLLWV